MYTSPNQRVITTNKEKTDTENIYTKININALDTALQVLRPNAFKLYVYFCKNINGYTFALSKIDVCKSLHITANTYLEAFKELESLGYLVKDKQIRTHYNFYEKAKEEVNEIVTINKETT